jgi:hypothetical protein
MLKTYRIIPLVFILFLFLFGFTLITVAPVFAEDSPEFVACQQIKPSGDFRLMKQKKNCFRDVARLSQQQSGDSMQLVAPTDPSGGEAQLKAKIAELESKVATLTTTNTELQEKLQPTSNPETGAPWTLYPNNAALLAESPSATAFVFGKMKEACVRGPFLDTGGYNGYMGMAKNYLEMCSRVENIGGSMYAPYTVIRKRRCSTNDPGCTDERNLCGYPDRCKEYDVLD